VLSNLSPGEKKKVCDSSARSVYMCVLLLASTLLLPRRTWVAPQPKSIRTNCWSTLPCVFTLLPRNKSKASIPPSPPMETKLYFKQLDEPPTSRLELSQNPSSVKGTGSSERGGGAVMDGRTPTPEDDCEAEKDRLQTQMGFDTDSELVPCHLMD
ncbi:Isoleucine--tRNA ligase, partial [Dissostichus eleginoides]